MAREVRFYNNMDQKVIKYIKGHFIQYFFLILLFILTIFAIDTTIPFYYKIRIIILSLSIFFIWNIYHTWEEHRLTRIAAIEYILLCLILLWLLINLAV